MGKRRDSVEHGGPIALPSVYSVAHGSHDDEMDHSMHSAEATTQERQRNAGRLLTASGAGAFSGAGVAQVAEEGESDEHWDARMAAIRKQQESSMDDVDEHGIPLIHQGGRARRMSQGEIAAFEKKKKVAQENILHHSERGVRDSATVAAVNGGLTRCLLCRRLPTVERTRQGDVEPGQEQSRLPGSD
jgi:hypothetical protein